MFSFLCIIIIIDLLKKLKEKVRLICQSEPIKIEPKEDGHEELNKKEVIECIEKEVEECVKELMNLGEKRKIIEEKEKVLNMKMRRLEIEKKNYS